LIRVSECAGNDVAEFGNVAHVDATHIWSKGKSPARGSITLLLRSKNAHKVLVVERRDDERMIRKLRFLDYRINPGLAGKVGSIELAAADRFYIRQRGPDKVFDTGILGSAYGGGYLLELVATFFQRIGNQKDAMCPFKCSFEGFRLV